MSHCLLMIRSHLPALSKLCARGCPVKPQKQKREAKRMIRQQTAWISRKHSAAAECEIMDLSHHGAKIVVGQTFAVPDRFELAFVQGDQKRRACEVIWRRGKIFGIKFVG
jgi:hypothetical protein